MTLPIRNAPPSWDDFVVGEGFRSRLGRTVTEMDNVWSTCLTHNTNQLHFNDEYAAASPFGKALVNSVFTLALITGLTVADTSEEAIANLGWDNVRLPNPVFVGDTLHAETTIVAKRRSESRPERGIVTVETSGVNQRGEVVISFTRTFMLQAPGVDDG